MVASKIKSSTGGVKSFLNVSAEDFAKFDDKNNESIYTITIVDKFEKKNYVLSNKSNDKSK